VKGETDNDLENLNPTGAFAINASSTFEGRNHRQPAGFPTGFFHEQIQEKNYD